LMDIANRPARWEAYFGVDLLGRISRIGDLEWQHHVAARLGIQSTCRRPEEELPNQNHIDLDRNDQCRRSGGRETRLRRYDSSGKSIGRNSDRHADSLQATNVQRTRAR